MSHRLLPSAPFLLTAMLALGGCGRPFDIRTPQAFVELDDQAPDYDYRATTAEGVVLAVRAIEDEARGNLAFWEQAIVLRMRDVAGYALIEKRDVSSADGTPGRELRFGHDEDGKPYAYWIRLYLAQGRLFLAEAGGKETLMTEHEATLHEALDGLALRCGCWVAPVLASRTCNRW
jgi:hypothetical protein